MKANPGKADARENKAKHDVAVVADENMRAIKTYSQRRHAGQKAVCVRAGLGSSNSFALELTPRRRARASRQAGPDGQGRARDDRPAQLSTL